MINTKSILNSDHERNTIWNGEDPCPFRGVCPPVVAGGCIRARSYFLSKKLLGIRIRYWWSFNQSVHVKTEDPDHRVEDSLRRVICVFFGFEGDLKTWILLLIVGRPSSACDWKRLDWAGQNCWWAATARGLSETDWVGSWR